MYVFGKGKAVFTFGNLGRMCFIEVLGLLGLIYTKIWRKF